MDSEIKKVNPTKPRTFHQLGIFVLDGSGSMSEIGSGNTIKGKEVDSAMFELFNRVKVSNVGQNFSFAVMKFDNEPTMIVDTKRFTYKDFVDNVSSYNTREGREADYTGGTEIYKALEKAEKLANDFLREEDTVPQSVLVMVMSDGLCFDPSRTAGIAERIKSNPLIKIAAVYMATIGKMEKAAEDLMKKIASDNMYTTVYDGQSLRNFFERSMTRTSGVKLNEQG